MARKIPQEYFSVIEKRPGNQPWTKRPWRTLTDRDVPLGSIIANPSKPEEAMAQLEFNPALDVETIRYKQFSAASHGTGNGDLLQEMPEKRREGFSTSALHLLTGATTFSRLQGWDSNRVAAAAAAAGFRNTGAEMVAGRRLFLVTGIMLSDGECKFTATLDGGGRSETHSEDRVDKQGASRRLLGLKLVEFWTEGHGRGRSCNRPYRPTTGYAYGYEADKVEGVYTVLDD